MKTEPQVHLQLKSRLLPVFVVLLVLLQLVEPYKGWIVLLVALGGLWLASYLWARSLANNLSLIREMRFGWAQVGDRLEERFTLKNTSWLPTPWVEVRDRSDLPGYHVSRATGIDAQSQYSWRTQGLCTQRGLFTLGPTLLCTGDPFGIYTVEKLDYASTSLLVMPPVVPLPSIEVAPGGRAGEGRPRRDAPERTVSISNVREYIPGDSLHLIHWRTTARREKAYVMVFDGTPAGDWWIVVDVNRQVQRGDGGNATGEHAVILAASLAERALELKRAVGLAANSDRLVWLPPKEGTVSAAWRLEILRALALIHPGDIPLVDLLRRAMPMIAKRSSLVIITPDLNPDWIEAIISLLRQGVVPTVLLLDVENWLINGAQAPVSTGAAKRMLQTLNKLGVRAYLIDRKLLDRPEARPGMEGQWEWRVSAQGKAIAVRKPDDLAWKKLS